MVRRHNGKAHRILALDLSRKSGWAFGSPGQKPKSGWMHFGPSDASHEAVFARAASWTRAAIDQWRPTLICWEAPIGGTGGRINTNTFSLLFGLPAIVGVTAYEAGIYDVRKATPQEVRMYFLGRNMRSADAKAATQARCRLLGWKFGDDNEADALATWDYLCHIVAPDLARSAPALPGILTHQRARVPA